MSKLAVRGWWLFWIAGSALLIVSSVSYLLPGLRHPFLLERMPLSLDGFWRVSLKVHVACGLVCLPMGLFLFVPRSRDRWPAFHRIVGRAYVALVLVLMVPSGVYLAPYSKYGWASGSGFLVSAVVLVVTTLDAVFAARRGDERRHRTAALHSCAQLASAISFRVYHLVFQLVELPYEANYVASVWLSVVGNAVVVELWIRCSHERSHHETSNHPGRSVVGLLAER